MISINLKQTKTFTMSFKKENSVVKKSYAFAIRIVKCYQLLRSEKQSYDLATQLVKSGTSIGANIEEAQGLSLIHI